MPTWKQRRKSKPPAQKEEDKYKKAESVKEAKTTLLLAVTTAEVVKTFHDCETVRSKKAMFKSMMNYLHRVETIFFYVAAFRKTDLALHCEAAEALSTMHFAMDRTNYNQLWPRYIADMYDLIIKHTKTRRELEAGNISVTKERNPVCIHWCRPRMRTSEQTDKGSCWTHWHIFNNANARQSSFMAAPELSKEGA